VKVRRRFIYIEAFIDQGTQRAVFQSNEGR